MSERILIAIVAFVWMGMMLGIFRGMFWIIGNS